MTELLNKVILGLPLSTWLLIGLGCVAALEIIYLIFRKKLDPIIIKHKEILLYLVFGVLTTVVNYLVYFPLASIPAMEQHKSWWIIVVNTIAWVVAVTFAFITNKLFVFESRKKDKKTLLKEIPSFVGARVVSLLIEDGIIALFATLLGFPDGIVKLVASIVTIILNYFFSKFFIFRKKGSEKNKNESDK